MGRSRKPLTGQPVRGFESHPLRHSFPACEARVLDALSRGELRYWFRSVFGFRQVPQSMTSTSKKADSRETDFSAQQPSAQADARLPGADAHEERPRRDRAAAPEGTQAPERLTAGVSPPPRPGWAPAGERLTSEERLRRRKDYLGCYRTGRRRHGSFAILYFVPNQLGHPRIGITASRKVGKAVVRQRLKRRIKEVYRRWQDRGRPPRLWDLVVHLKPEAGKSDFQALRAELLRLLFGGCSEDRPRGIGRAGGSSSGDRACSPFPLGLPISAGSRRCLPPLLLLSPPRAPNMPGLADPQARPLGIGGLLTAGRLMRCQPSHPGGNRTRRKRPRLATPARTYDRKRGF